MLPSLVKNGTYGDHFNTYHLSNKRASDVISYNLQFCERVGLETREEHKSLPSMYWMSKLGYTPPQARVIVTPPQCSTKPISKVMFKLF